MMMATSTTPGAELRILVVEDETLIAEEIRDRLTRLHFRVVAVVDTGAAAIQAAAELVPDLVLMDIRLKGAMDGIEAATQIRANLPIPVVFLTAHSDHATLQRAKDAAPFGYILKPFHERDLLVGIEMAVHRSRLEARLKDSEQRYAVTLASIGDGVIATDQDGYVTFMNPVAEALTAWPFAAAKGMSIAQILPIVREADQSVSENPAMLALRNRDVVHLHEPVLLITRKQEAILIDDSAAPITDDRGKIIGAVIAFRDIRQRRLAQTALQQAQEQLRQAQKMEALGRLAGAAASDFNNLLVVINGYTEMLLKGGGLSDSVVNLLLEIRKAGERAASLTNPLLTFGRQKTTLLTTLHLGALVNGAGPMLRRIIGPDVVLELRSNAAHRQVKADPMQLEQVLMNLATNARDAMREGGTLTIEVSDVDVTSAMLEGRPEALPGRYVLLTVADSGAGMDQATQDRLFEPFFTTKELGRGLGLGLAVVYGIVKQSGGFLAVVSAPGQGATFKIYLPAVDADVRAAAAQPAGATSRPRECVLLVDDDEAVRFLTLTALRLHGYRVLQAKNGEEALRLAEAHPAAIDLLITDVAMPGLSGREIAAQLATLQPTARVLYLTDSRNHAVAGQELLKDGADVIEKPFTLNTFTEKVYKMLMKPAAGQ
ncbi:MAG: response regulator [Planctomycetes bacterium]|nr:response regulator [Planctomycetota bacterium]